MSRAGSRLIGGDIDTRVAARRGAALIVISVNYHSPLESVSQEVERVVELERVSRDSRQIPRTRWSTGYRCRGSAAGEREVSAKTIYANSTRRALFR